MTPLAWERRKFTLERFCLKSIPYLPKKSKYRSWAYLLIGEQPLEIAKFCKLESRIRKFWKEEYL